MRVQRGDVVLVSLRFSSGTQVKVRPVLVVQSDRNNQRLSGTIVAVVTSNVSRAGREPTQMLVDPSTPEGQHSGLLRLSAVTCESLHTVLQADIRQKIGILPKPAMQRVDPCLKAALEIA